ncbi:hypothetical protein EP12_01380 [Alteromonas australica]|nr:hypothetical protein EP12_01380 [Alteromonas australica]
MGETYSKIDVPAEYEETVHGSWLREKIRIIHPETRERIAWAQQEIVKLSEIAARAHRRNRNFAEKLGVDAFIDKEK